MSAKMIRFSLFLQCGWILSSWNVPYLPPLAIDHASIGNETKDKKCALREQYQCDYLTHQKNRLACFAEHDGFIWFDDKQNKYSFFLSNYYPANISMWGMKFYCAEAAFQAAKFLDKPDLAVRFTHLDGEDAWTLARELSDKQRGDWYRVREAIMLEVLKAKFQQNSELSELLLATGKAYLVENSSRDTFWADGGDGQGKNRLGNLLMKVRAEKGGGDVVPPPKKYFKFVE